MRVIVPKKPPARNSINSPNINSGHNNGVPFPTRANEVRNDCNNVAHNSNSTPTNMNMTTTYAHNTYLSIRPIDRQNTHDSLDIRCDSRQSRKPKKHKASPPDIDDGYNSADEYGGNKGCQHDHAMSAIDIELRFEEELKMKKGYYIKKMKEDGNCLFRSIADQIYGDEEMHNVVRAMCMDYMIKERDHFSQFITEDFDAYISRKREDKCYGNNVEMQAFTEVFGRPIEVYSGRGDAPINIFNGSYTTDNPPILLSYHGGNHYNSVIDPNNPSVGVGLGLPEYKPGDRSIVAEALKVSEQEDLERRFIEESIKSSELSATELEIEEAILAASHVEYIASLFSHVRVPAMQDNVNNNNILRNNSTNYLSDFGANGNS